MLQTPETNSQNGQMELQSPEITENQILNKNNISSDESIIVVNESADEFSPNNDSHPIQQFSPSIENNENHEPSVSRLTIHHEEMESKKK